MATIPINATQNYSRVKVRACMSRESQQCFRASCCFKRDSLKPPHPIPFNQKVHVREVATHQRIGHQEAAHCPGLSYSGCQTAPDCYCQTLDKAPRSSCAHLQARSEVKQEQPRQGRAAEWRTAVKGAVGCRMLLDSHLVMALVDGCKHTHVKAERMRSARA